MTVRHKPLKCAPRSRQATKPPKTDVFLKIFFQKSIDGKYQVCRIRTSRSKAAEKRSLTIYQAKQTVWALAEVSKREIVLQLLNECS
ncbi:MAG: hypothetical protein ACQEQZ_00465, partial [Pseudomonadota bacterium]